MEFRVSYFQSAVVACAFVVGSSAWAASSDWPTRTTPRPATTDGVPHVQIDVKPVPALSAELLQRVAGIPDVEIGNTVISLPGAKGFRLVDGLALARPDAIVGGREFAHMHPDGSLHASLHPETARAAVDAGWAIAHPWAKRRQGWEGFVMIYTPQTADELDVVFDLVRESYSFVTGRSVD